MQLGTNLKEKGYYSPISDRKFSEGDSILLKDHTTSVWDLRYTRNYQIVSFPSKTQVKMVDSKDKVKIVHISDFRYVLAADRVMSKLPHYQFFGLYIGIPAVFIYW